MQEKIKLLKLGIVILFLGMVLFGGCRYQWQSPFPSSISKIAIPTFLNETFEYELERTLTNLVKEEFLFDGHIDIVEENEADLKLEGKITYYDGRELLPGAVGAEEYRVRIAVVVSLTLGEEREDLPEIEETTVYSLVGTIQTEDGAKNETCRKIGQELIRLIWERWKR